MTEPAFLSYGQLSVWRDVRDLEPARRHEANTRSIWMPHGQPDAAGPPHTVADVEQALLALGRRHESLRTVYDLSDPYAPTQRVLPPCPVDGGVFECDPDDPDAFDEYADRLAAEPFDLAREPGWRYRIVTQAGVPRAAIVVKHHIAADGWSDDALRGEFQSLLRDGTGPERPAPPTPRELSRWQRDGGGGARAAAQRAHWEDVFGRSAAALRRGEAAGADEGFQCTARSRAAYTGADLLARRLSVPLSSVVLAAFAWSAASRAGAGEPVAQLMSSNRFIPPWNTVISSMNQWTAAALDSPDGEFDSFVRHVHARSLSAYRHGMYDVDENDLLRDKLRAGREPYEATCAYNYLGGASAASAAGRAPEPESEPELVWEAPFSRIGHPCYLRAAGIGGHTLELRLRTLGLAKSLTGEIVADVLSRLTDAASPGA